MARKRTFTGMEWPMVAAQAWWLGVESSWVIGLRCARLVEGGAAADHEAVRMVAEKWQAQVDLAAELASGRLGSQPHDIAAATLSHYSRRVRANRSRLTR